MVSFIKDPSAAASGLRKIDWVKSNMPILRSLETEFLKTKPFSGLKMTVSVHLEAKTAYLVTVLASGGAQVFATGSNPLSTQDDVAAGLATYQNVEVFGFHGASASEYESHIEAALLSCPDIIIDDGGDLISLLHTKRRDLMKNVRGGCEETTTGILRLQAMEKEGALSFPMIAVNNAMCKYLFDNRYGTGQSVWDGINRTTNLIVAGKTVVVAGYGWCGKGVAMRGKGFGAKVVITEIDPVKALEAYMDGFTVMPMSEAAKIGDFFITVTGCRDVITKEHFPLMKDGAILCNAGHFDVEVSRSDLEDICVSKRERRNNIIGYTLKDGNTLNLIGEGRLVNLAAGDGHPAEIMDMSFALQALSAKYLAEHSNTLKNKVLDVPEEIDRFVANAKLKSLSVAFDSLTEVQMKYLDSWGQ
ncbi:MAG: adenosylhomocysteinase [Clostridiales bacterium]|nr:adenosylhomocysteinase [Clostridiales bacterium]